VIFMFRCVIFPLVTYLTGSALPGKPLSLRTRSQAASTDDVAPPAPEASSTQSQHDLVAPNDSQQSSVQNLEAAVIAEGRSGHRSRPLAQPAMITGIGKPMGAAWANEWRQAQSDKEERTAQMAKMHERTVAEKQQFDLVVYVSDVSTLDICIPVN